MRRSWRRLSRLASSAGNRTWAIDFASTKRCTGTTTALRSTLATCLLAPSTPNEQYAQTEAILRSYNQNYNATPSLNARFEALAEERIHDDPIRYYVALPVARLLNMIFRPRA